MGKKSLRAEREFGLIVGGVLLLLSAWWLYRGKFPSVSQITLPFGAALVFFGFVLPRALVWPNKAWMAFAEVLSFVSTPIILAFVFLASLRLSVSSNVCSVGTRCMSDDGRRAKTVGNRKTQRAAVRRSGDYARRLFGAHSNRTA